MKKIVFFLTAVLLVMASCSKMERNEKKFIKGILSEDFEESAKANQEFIQWLSKDKATMTYDFKLMREKLGLKVTTSPDSLLRCYSWCANSSSETPYYDNAVQWLYDGHFVAYNGSLNYLLTGRKANIKKQSSLGHSIDTIFQINSGDKPVYLIAQSYVDSEKKKHAYVTAAYMVDYKLMILPTFFDGIEFSGNNVFVDKDNTAIGELFKWDEKAGKFYAYQTDDSLNLIPGKYTTYVLGNNRFNRILEE